MKKTEDVSGKNRSARPLGIYIHYPFCTERCFYCDFLTFPHAETLQAPYISALKKEIAHLGQAETKQTSPLLQDTPYFVDSVYFGGGTPSLLPTEEFLAVVETLRANFSFANDVEITLEVNPGTLTEEGLRRLLTVGVNRFSLGVQTMSDALLARLGRTHMAEDVEHDIRMLQNAGANNVNVDFLLGLPAQTLADIQKDLLYVAQWHVQHVSWYSLILEEKTYFHWQAQQGDLSLPEENLLLQEEDEVLRTLSSLGYTRYEISNFSLPSYASRHNRKYWTAEEYLGIGVGAASYLQGERYQNPSGIHAYIKEVEEGRLPQQLVERTIKEDLFEQVMMGLRLLEGVDREAFLKRNGMDALAIAPKSMAKAQKNGLLCITPTNIAFTRKGLNVQNDVLSDMLWEWEG